MPFSFFKKKAKKPHVIETELVNIHGTLMQHDLTALQTVFDTIHFATRSTTLQKALADFRRHFAEGRFDIEIVTEALKLHIKKTHSELSNPERNNLFWCQVIGYLQRQLATTPYAHGIAKGIYFVANKGEPVDLEQPIILRDTHTHYKHPGLGYDYAIGPKGTPLTQCDFECYLSSWETFTALPHHNPQSIVRMR